MKPSDVPRAFRYTTRRRAYFRAFLQVIGFAIAAYCLAEFFLWAAHGDYAGWNR